MKLELSHIIAILTIVASLAGFYYTTQHRLDHLESVIEGLKEEDVALRKAINKKGKKK